MKGQEKMPKAEGRTVTKGSGNVYADLGYSDPEAMLAKAELVRQIAAIIREKGWSQAEAADRVDLDQPKISKLLRGQFRDFGTDRLMKILTKLQQDIEIRVSPADPKRPVGHLSVVRRGVDRMAAAEERKPEPVKFS